MRTPSSLTAVLAVSMFAWIGGCAAPAGPLSLSISELGSEVQEDAGSFTSRISHRRSHNITGLGSADMVGMLSADPDPPVLFRWPTLFSRPNLPDQMAPRIKPQCSKVVVRDLPMAQGKGMAEVLTLRDSLQMLQAAEFQRLRLSAEAALVGEIVNTFDASKGATPAADAASAAAADARTQGVEQRRVALTDAWRKLSGTTDTPADAAAWKEQLKALGERIGEAQAKVAAEAARFRGARQEQGVIVARWEYEASKRSGLEAIGVSASSRKADARTGFVVLGHPRTLTLVAGDDLVSRACRAEGANCKGIDPDTRSGIDSMIPARRVYTTMFQLMAQHVAWAESGVVEQQAALALQVTEIAKTLSGAGLATIKDKLQALQVEITAGSQSRTSAENLGAVTGSRQWDERFTFWNDDAYMRSVTYLRALNGDFFPLSSMRTTLDAYAEKFGARKPASEDDCVNAGPTPQDVKRVVHAHLGCDRLGEPGFVNTLDAPSVASHREQCGRQDAEMRQAQGLPTTLVVDNPVAKQ